MNHLTADLIDAHGDKLQSCELQFRQYGGRRIFHGPVRTIKTLEDNALVKQLLSGPGHGAVLVIDGGGSLRTALLGDMIAGAAQKNGWAGVILHGAVRDTLALARLEPAQERQAGHRRGGCPGESRRRDFFARRVGLL